MLLGWRCLCSMLGVIPTWETIVVIGIESVTPACKVCTFSNWTLGSSSNFKIAAIVIMKLMRLYPNHYILSIVVLYSIIEPVCVLLIWHFAFCLLKWLNLKISRVHQGFSGRVRFSMWVSHPQILTLHFYIVFDFLFKVRIQVHNTI